MVICHVVKSFNRFLAVVSTSSTSVPPAALRTVKIRSMSWLLMRLSMA